MFSVLYASRSTISPSEANGAVEALVSVSRSRNEKASVTGCLIFGAGRFAQILEGEQAAVEDIMLSISRDPRHADVTILEQGGVLGRRFVGWALGYAGPSLFVQRTITRPVSEALRGSERGILDLIHIMTRFHEQQTAASS
ncbi:MAG: BLUF domain-containing protein [Sphingobium sp.]